MAGYHQLRHLLTRSLVTSSTSRLANPPRYLITGGMGQLGPELAKNLRYLCSYIGMIIITLDIEHNSDKTTILLQLQGL